MRSPCTSLRGRVAELIQQHGGLRAAARAVQLDAGYLSRLSEGKKSNPTDSVLRKLGLRMVPLYIRSKA